MTTPTALERLLAAEHQCAARVAAAERDAAEALAACEAEERDRDQAAELALAAELDALADTSRVEARGGIERARAEARARAAGLDALPDARIEALAARWVERALRSPP